MTIRLTEFEAAKAGSLPMAAQGQGSAEQVAKFVVPPFGGGSPISGQRSNNLFPPEGGTTNEQFGRTTASPRQTAGLQTAGLLTGKCSTNQRFVFYLISLLLAATALAKLWMLLTDPFADIRVGIPNEILWGAVVFELWLAIENWRIRDLRILALVDTVTFAWFAIFAGTRWAMGYTSCGCSGSIEVPPWLFIMLDLIIVAWFLVFARRSFVLDAKRELANWRSGTWTWNDHVGNYGKLNSPAVGSLMAWLLLGGAIVLFQVPTIKQLINYKLFGQDVVVDAVDLGDIEFGRVTPCKLDVQNVSDREIYLLGTKSSCTCLVTNDRLLQIQPNSQTNFTILVTPRSLGHFRQRLICFLGGSRQSFVAVDIKATVR